MNNSPNKQKVCPSCGNTEDDLFEPDEELGIDEPFCGRCNVRQSNFINKQSLPITEMLEKHRDGISWSCEYDGVDAIREILPQVRTLETEHVANVSKAHKEGATEERERIIGVLNQDLNIYDKAGAWDYKQAIYKAINRIQGS